MSEILRSDFYRLCRSKLFYGLAAFAALISFGLMMLIRQDIRLGISVFGDLTAFKAAGDIIRIGIEYNKGLGFLAAILLSAFIEQEYQWKTWQHKLIANKSRARIYLSKAIVSSAASAVIFLIYEMIALLISRLIPDLSAKDFIATILCGLFLYAALGTVLCLLSMLIRNGTAPVACFFYVLFGETIVSVMRKLSGFSDTAERFVELCARHSVYGMSEIVSSPDFSANYTIIIVINSLAIMLLSTALGLAVFRKYEL
jgi:ABC-type transport system involved in multi-copper enzyme maturation permease subunit